MSEQYIRLDQPITVNYTATLQVEAIQIINPSVHQTMNILDCAFCGEAIGHLRPIAIVFGKREFHSQSHYMRLCNTCYLLVKNEAKL